VICPTTLRACMSAQSRVLHRMPSVHPLTSTDPHPRLSTTSSFFSQVFEHRAAFLKMLNENQTIVLEGETGSGKTTQVRAVARSACRRRCLGLPRSSRPMGDTSLGPLGSRCE
jgi:DNA-binding NtrC family response regulator